MIISVASHLDHGLKPEHIEWMLWHYLGRDGFFIDTTELPAHLPRLQCHLHGPAMGDPPVSQHESFLARRKGRGNESRVCNRSPRKTDFITVIAGPDKGDSCVLYTAYGGPSAPKEVDGSMHPESAQYAASKKFWSQHALTYDATTMEPTSAMPPLPPSREDLVQAGRFMLRAYQLGARLRAFPFASTNAEEARRVNASVNGAHDVCAKMGGKR